MSGVVALLVVTIVLSILTGKQLYIFGYIMAIVYAMHGPVHGYRPWRELGLKLGFLKDLKDVWYYVGIVVVLFQVLPVILAYPLGFYSGFRQSILGRLATNLGPVELATLGGLLATMLVLTLLEEVVFRVSVQERLSWFVGTPVAILFASILFGLAHLVGASGSWQFIILNVASVALDGIVFGIIYARTHNVALTWATHYSADVVGLFVLLLIL